MRFVLAIFAVAATLAFASHPAQTGGEGVIRVGFYPAEVGEQVTVVLEAVDIPPPGVGAWTIDISYDNSIVDAIGCDSRPDGVCSPAFMNDTVRATGASETGLSGTFTLATFEFTCGFAGTAELILDDGVLATADPVMDIEIPLEDGSITCTEPFDLITLSSLDLLVGQQGTVLIEAELVAKPGLGAWTLDISYDNTVVTATECIGLAGSVCNPVFDEDTVRVAGASASGLTGRNELGTITFLCDRPGESPLMLRLSIWGNAIETDQRKVELEEGTITCRSEIPADLPSTGGAELQPSSLPATVPLAVLGVVLLAAAFAFRRYAPR